MLNNEWAILRPRASQRRAKNQAKTLKISFKATHSRWKSPKQRSPIWPPRRNRKNLWRAWRYQPSDPNSQTWLQHYQKLAQNLTIRPLGLSQAHQASARKRLPSRKSR
ncbi:unnamed protein product [Blepharisma stoltei]|uniref:Uncharacterized protein n=1 Tax=Blepharisma stoltei TaxID=1481888 RepID=A0AAU9IVE6_9CILI|nr:unnamed protein product [Blepharisma stoltei]